MVENESFALRTTLQNWCGEQSSGAVLALKLSPQVSAAQQLSEHCVTGCVTTSLVKTLFFLGGKLVLQKSGAFLLLAIGKRISNLGFEL